MALIKDRRQFARVEVKWFVIILSSEDQPPGEIKSISQVGASIYCQKPLPAGQELGLEIQPPNLQSILVFARPIWAIDVDSSESPHCFVFGVRFEYLSEEDIQFLGDIVSTLRSQTNLS
jgi:hypothetical protein